MAASGKGLEDVGELKGEVEAMLGPDGQPLSRAQLNKLKKKQEKEAKKAARAAAQAEQNAAKAAAETKEDPNVWGRMPLIRSSEKPDRVFAQLHQVGTGSAEKEIWLRGRVHNRRVQGKKMCFITFRQQTETIQAVLFADNKPVTVGMVKFAAALPLESIIDLQGVVKTTAEPIKSCTHADVEVHVKKLFLVSEARDLPILVEDASRSEEDIRKGIEANPDAPPVRVEMPTRLDNRHIDLRTPANHAIMRLQAKVCQLFRDFLTGRGFVEIHTPKLISAASEGGANVFEVKYFERKAYLAQSPQLYKQMAICSDLNRVFEIAPVFRAENSLTHRHLTEFTGLDMEMAFDYHYHEVLKMLMDMFEHMFAGLATCERELNAVNRQHPFNPFVFKPVMLNFPEAVAMLRADGWKTIAGEEVGELEDFDTPTEKRLGQLVKEKYETDFYVLDRFPSAVRPFYTMKAPDDERYSNSYDFFVRGEEILSGAQRIHDVDMLLERVKEHGIDPATVQGYVDSFKHGVPPHAGAGIGLERILMLYLGLDNVRKACMFPRDPKRISP